MKKILEFLKESNHWKHLLGGFIVGMGAASPYAAAYSAIVAASCLELKDYLYGNKFDFIDWALTFAGGAMAALVWLIMQL